MSTFKRETPIGRRSLARSERWGITVAATAISAYALDAIAAAAGLIVVSSNLLGAISHAEALLFLAMTYIAWGAGLRVNLSANWALLESTGTSTNLLSKAAYELVKVKTPKIGLRKFAAGAGYTGTELAKEAPYYFGAFGAAVLTDTVSAPDAIVFLGGANLGAAIYEYGLARIVREFLRRREAPTYASFESDWSPRDYLADYYSKVEPDEWHTIAFFGEAMKSAAAREPILFFGCGPTLHHVFLAADIASAIDLGDYLPANLREIQLWIDRDPEAHDWSPFVRHTLACEGKTSPTSTEIAHREELVRQKIRSLLTVDIRHSHPLGDENAAQYGTVISAYCADSATSDRCEWTVYMNRIAALVRPGGTLLIAALRRSRGYGVGGKTFPSANVDEDDLRAVLEAHFGQGNVTVVVHELTGTSSKGYSSIVLARATSVGAECIFASETATPSIENHRRSSQFRANGPQTEIAPQHFYRNSIWLTLQNEWSREPGPRSSRQRGRLRSAA
ncbi:MAG: guanitoxin biosynthesis pre-guanitoxin forming N-methyltransferase GntF [Aestuariivirga sp.]